MRPNRSSVGMVNNSALAACGEDSAAREPCYTYVPSGMYVSLIYVHDPTATFQRLVGRGALFSLTGYFLQLKYAYCSDGFFPSLSRVSTGSLSTLNAIAVVVTWGDATRGG